MSEKTEVEILSRLLDLAARYNLEELQVEESGLKVTLYAASSDGDIESVGGTEGIGEWKGPVNWILPKDPEMQRPQRSETAKPLLAPLTGVFYRKEKPELPPFVEVGQAVEEGQQIGLIEAMKVFTPITADRAGTVVEIVAQNAQIIEHGKVILYIEPST